MYVILQPHSNTNPTDKYRVVDYDDWCRYRIGEQVAYQTTSEHDDYTTALAARDWHNQPLATPYQKMIDALDKSEQNEEI